MKNFEFVVTDDLQENINYMQNLFANKRLMLISFGIAPLIYFLLCSVIILFS